VLEKKMCWVPSSLTHLVAVTTVMTNRSQCLQTDQTHQSLHQLLAAS